MPVCLRCGAKTILYVDNVPTCPKCDTEQDRKLETPKSPCAERDRILGDLSDAMNTIMILGSQEIQAVIAGHIEFLDRLKIEEDRAIKRKDVLLLEYKKHVDAHGC